MALATDRDDNDKSPLHLGDGGTRDIRSSERAYPKELEGKWPKTPEYATVFMNHQGRPALPGTSLKGALRGWAKAQGLDDKRVDAVFGSPAQGGRVTFRDATLRKAAKPQHATYRYWSDARQTCLTPKVAIDPKTGAAQEGLLYHIEYLIPGSVFEWSIEGHCVPDGDRGFLLLVLENAFCDDDQSARLGADVADGWGKVSWRAAGVEELDVASWLKGPLKPWREAMRTLDGPERQQWLQPDPLISAPAPDDVVTIALTMDFDGAMLVNDPTRQKKRVEGQPEGTGHATLRREGDETPYLPASSVRGALRSQARRIWQTLAKGNSQDLDATGVRLAASSRKDLHGTAPFQLLFGATGWRSPIEIEDFSLEGDPVEHRQEFVAIDRFTGGAAEKLKFSADGLWKPRFRGFLRIRTDRWRIGDRVLVGQWAWLLLAYVLRDWNEGDGRIGFGASKGYGAFRARVEVSGGGDDAKLLGRLLLRDPSTLEMRQLEEWDESLRGALAAATTQGEA